MSSTMLLLGHAWADSLPWLQMPPLHPILVNFTAALVPVSFATDLAGRLTHRETLRATGWWTMCVAAAVTPLTAVAGWLWLSDMTEMADGPMPIHQWLGTALAGLFAALAVWRWRIHRRGDYAGGAYLGVAGLLVLALVLQGHLGGLMSFGSGGGAGDDAEQPTVVPNGAPPAATQPAIQNEQGEYEHGSDGHAHGHDDAHGSRAGRDRPGRGGPHEVKTWI